MVGEYKLRSTVKAVKITDVEVPAGQKLEAHGIVFIGEKVGVVVDKIDDKTITVNIDTQREFTTDTFDEANLPKVGEKLFLDATGKLTKTSGDKWVGYFWSKLNNQIAFSLRS
ncbi:capsid cement protein [Treponema phagedenis]|uniref:Uncharacterized protein n=1 Tax=Treponema phagedenis TaxID=162 RepID=A0AAE6ITD3_TREPH|nr:capsid cement protein [Treponema phagedenis]QEJ97954.1 hypothetical protein FUT82_08060 [Treponema phagedenis]QEK06201.1 hypothetical protein FUT80_05430 [Treponema phagedenis]